MKIERRMEFVKKSSIYSGKIARYNHKKVLWKELKSQKTKKKRKK